MWPAHRHSRLAHCNLRASDRTMPAFACRKQRHGLTRTTEQSSSLMLRWLTRQGKGVLCLRSGDGEVTVLGTLASSQSGLLEGTNERSWA
jgi:hypothetical protein